MPPRIAPASDEGIQAMKSFQFPRQLKIDLFAAEPDLANPVAFHVDYQGRVWVCESFRQGKGIEDNRKHGDWLDDDLAAQTVEDRIAYIRKHLGQKAIEYTKYDDRIRLLEDTDGNHHADRSVVFADHFNGIEMGTGAGVLSYRNRVYYTCIPHLWMLEDLNGDGVSDQRKSLQQGYGVRFAFRGHDCHGLIVGPDGRLYFSIGDRGYNIKQGNRTIKDPTSGAVFRCELDGSNLEVIATGLRNPQELAFDKYGNLFTGDNNSDSGDRARWVYVVPGSDSGWRMYYQYLPDRGPFNREKVWHPYDPDVTPAYIVPPVANLADGPSGLAYYPGTGLGDSFRDRFFLCDFRGGPVNSGIRTFRVQPKGAFFEVLDMEKTFWRQLVTDVQFGPDGALYVSDWVNGWEGLGKGRIYRYSNPASERDMLVAEVRKLLAKGLKDQSRQRLISLLDSPDMRIRQEAQFELVARNETESLVKVATDSSKSTLARIHALWGLEQLTRHRSDKSVVLKVLGLLGSSDDEVRAQTVKLIGDCGMDSLLAELVDCLEDDSPRVRYFATIAIGQQKASSQADLDKARDAIFGLLDSNADRDPILRHGAIMALVGLNKDSVWDAALDSGSKYIQQAAVVALRKLGSDRLQDYVEGNRVDSLDPKVLLEAVRAIHDLPRYDLFRQVASLTRRTSLPDPILRRALNARYRLGTSNDAVAIAQLAADRRASTKMRREAVAMLKNWAKPSNRDRVLGDWRPIDASQRTHRPAAVAVRAELAGMLTGDSDLTRAVIDAAASLGIREIEPAVNGLFVDAGQGGSIRADALRALETIRSSQLKSIVEKALGDPAPQVRIAARDILSRIDPAQAIRQLNAAIGSGTPSERQQALATLARMKPESAVPVLTTLLKRLVAGDFPPDSRLDLLLATEKIRSPEVQRLVKRYNQSKPKNNPLAPYLDCMVGGDSASGRRIFFEKASVYCVRCHRIDGRGGEVGPDLSKIGKDKDRTYLLEAIVNPNATIAKDFETVMIATDDGLTYSGILKSETADEIVLVTPEGKTQKIRKEFIEQRGKGKSSMPADLIQNLSLAEIRDLVEFLFQRK